MKRAILFGGLAGAALLIGQGGDARVFVDFQEVMIPMRDGDRFARHEGLHGRYRRRPRRYPGAGRQ